MFSLTLTLQRGARRLTLALLMAGAAAVAAAAPASNYHVEIDTSRFSGAGFLDFAFIAGNAGAPAASATLSHFSGAFGQLVTQEGDVSGALPGSLRFGTGAFYNDLFHSVTLGGKFSFDIQFGGAFLSTPGTTGTTFGVGLLDAGGGNYLGNPGGNVVQFELMPSPGVGPGSVSGAGYSDFASISAVPEAGEWLMLSAGLGLLGWRARRRQPGAVRAG
ncbi:NF038129 family PEP-CTERM protein [Janthinobacterium sp.]|uniref:NF038129 family PEP-CTERM protein n=1 Tax=Janthinobacterium sp. TaxID=1871054 RepID=UPI00293D30C7|nr:NF038129 family PEP-CTERM protein [Janthinobacterium sp.]